MSLGKEWERMGKNGKEILISTKVYIIVKRIDNSRLS